jgi:hypothetical protein
MREVIQSAVAPLSDWRIVTLQLAGNALLLAAATLWLLIPEVHVWQLLFAVVTGLAILFAFAWLHCGTFAHGFTPTRESLYRDFRASLRHVPAFALFAATLILLMNWVGNYAEDHGYQISGYFFTRLPHFLQRIGEVRFYEWVMIKFAVSIWFLLPALFLPFLSAAAYSGFSRRGLAAALRTYARWRYWLMIAIAALIGVWLPYLLANWSPAAHGLRKETLSMALRLVTAYALAALSWVMASAVTAGFLHARLSGENRGGNAAV